MISELRPIQPSGGQIDFDKRFLATSVLLLLASAVFSCPDFMKKLYVKYPAIYRKTQGKSEK